MTVLYGVLNKKVIPQLGTLYNNDSDVLDVCALHVHIEHTSTRAREYIGRWVVVIATIEENLVKHDNTARRVLGSWNVRIGREGNAVCDKNKLLLYGSSGQLIFYRLREGRNTERMHDDDLITDTCRYM